MNKEYYKVSRKYEDDPELVNIIKETQMCFYTDEVVDKRFYKMESFRDDEKLKGIIAYNKYYYLFDNKEKAYKFNNSRILKSFSEKAKEQPKEMFNQIKVLEKALELACERLKNLYCSDYCGNICDDWCVTEEDFKQECKLYYKCWNKDCILEQAKETMKNE